jgi:predicted transcriptional regulator
MIATQDIDLAPVPVDQLLSPIGIFRQIQASDNLTKVTENVQSSHEPILVYSHDQFVGVTSLTKLLFTSRMPYTAKAGKHLIPLPTLTKDSLISEIAETMQSTRLYALPILDGDEPIGVLEASKIFTWLSSDAGWMDVIAKKIALRQPVIIPDSMRLSEVRDHLKKVRQSRAVIVDQNQKTIGIVTRNDLKDLYLSPSPRQRFSRKNGIKISFDPKEKITRQDIQVSKVMTKNVNTHSPAPTKQLLRDLIASDFNSVVIIDKHDVPQHILSNRDIIEALSKLKPDTIWF